MSNWETIAIRLINVACAESAEAHRKIVKARAKVRRAARVKHELYGLEFRAHLSFGSERRHVSAVSAEGRSHVSA